jgi:nucleoside-diphosphate-sugar epimerase
MSEQLTLITGGAGFIGCNLAHRLLSSGRKVRVLDNLARPGVELNLQWLREQHGDRLQVVTADIRDEKAVTQAVAGTTQVFHFASRPRSRSPPAWTFLVKTSSSTRKARSTCWKPHARARCRRSCS